VGQAKLQRPQPMQRLSYSSQTLDRAHLGTEIFGNGDPDVVFPDVFHGLFAFRGALSVEEGVYIRVAAVEVPAVVPRGDVGAVALAGVGAHADAEAVFKGFRAAHKDEMRLFPDGGVVAVGKLVVEIYLVQPAHGVEIAAAQQHQPVPLGRCGDGHVVLGKIKERGVGGQERRLEGVVGFLVEHYVPGPLHGVVAHHVRFGETPCAGKELGRVHVVFFPELCYQAVGLGFR
jgi:hypothetical protein